MRATAPPKHLTITVMLVGGIALAYVLYPASPGPEEPDQPQKAAESVTQTDTPNATESRRKASKEEAPAMQGDLSFEEVVELMQERHGGELGTRLGQIDMINALIAYLKKTHPDNWQVMMEKLLNAAFPDQAAELLELANNHLEYVAWRRQADAELRQLDNDARMEMLMEQRREIFGEAVAEDLWKHQIRDYETQKAIERLASESDRPVNERLDEFSSVVKENYSEEALKNQSTSMGDSFASQFLEATQDELRDMEAQQRQQTINETRRQLGYSESAVENLARLDRTRDKRWESGEQYMEKRERIMANYEGEERQERLRSAREQIQGASADTIRKEEESGHFRFEQERTYGLQ